MEGEDGKEPAPPQASMEGEVVPTALPPEDSAPQPPQQQQQQPPPPPSLLEEVLPFVLDSGIVTLDVRKHLGRVSKGCHAATR